MKNIITLPKEDYDNFKELEKSYNKGLTSYKVNQNRFSKDKITYHMNADLSKPLIKRLVELDQFVLDEKARFTKLKSEHKGIRKDIKRDFDILQKNFRFSKQRISLLQQEIDRSNGFISSLITVLTLGYYKL